MTIRFVASTKSPKWSDIKAGDTIRMLRNGKEEILAYYFMSNDYENRQYSLVSLSNPDSFWGHIDIAQWDGGTAPNHVLLEILPKGVYQLEIK